MKHPALALAAPALVGAVILGGAPAQAAEHHDHATKAERRHDRKVEHRAARKAAHKPAQGTVTTPAAPIPTGGRTAKPIPERASRGAVPCAVTADRAGTAFLVHNGCQTPEAITVSVQSQPGPWHVGLCQTGGCQMLIRYDLVIQPGTHSISSQSNACFYQVDLKWHGALIRSNHFVNDCTPTKPRPPIVHPKPKPPVQTYPHARVRLTSTPTSSSMTALPRTGGGEQALLAYLGFGLLVIGGSLRIFTRYPKRVTDQTRTALQNGQDR